MHEWFSCWSTLRADTSSSRCWLTFLQIKTPHSRHHTPPCWPLSGSPKAPLQSRQTWSSSTRSRYMDHREVRGQAASSVSKGLILFQIFRLLWALESLPELLCVCWWSHFLLLQTWGQTTVRNLSRDENILQRSLPESKHVVIHVKITYCSLKNQFRRISLPPQGPFCVILKLKWASKSAPDGILNQNCWNNKTCCRQNVFQGVFLNSEERSQGYTKGKKVSLEKSTFIWSWEEISQSELDDPPLPGPATVRFHISFQYNRMQMMKTRRNKDKGKRWKNTITTSWLWL